MSYDIRLQNFEGPLDLLLHLIRQNEMDITDIRIAEITGQYLAILDQMQQLNLDVAGEFLLMAATLLQIKSRLLLPVIDEEGEEVEEDPRAELVRRLLEFQKYKEAALCLDDLPRLDRDLFSHRCLLPELVVEEGDASFEHVGLYELAAAFRQVLTSCGVEMVHEVNAEELSVTDRINAILARLTTVGHLGFTDLFPSQPRRSEVVVSFLAVLELVKMRLLRLVQVDSLGPIWLYPAVTVAPDELRQLEDDSLGYA